MNKRVRPYYNYECYFSLFNLADNTINGVSHSPDKASICSVDIHPNSAVVYAESLVDPTGKEFDASHLGSSYHCHVYFFILFPPEDMHNCSELEQKSK